MRCMGVYTAEMIYQVIQETKVILTIDIFINISKMYENIAITEPVHLLLDTTFQNAPAVRD